MHLDAAAAQALAMIIFTNIQPPQGLQPQLPLHTIDRGGSWLVKGTPYTNVKSGVHLATIPDTTLRADDRPEVRHISMSDPKSGRSAELMSFSRLNGKVLSGDL